ncbi:bile acid:sodium symporter family protein [Aneurinibacillus sp. Ricciae_BoGa-3]|uniref:bile acid:sodium symporter family protein n=1 Tax=Aneurinibacillus sp. Ricciae_BoGa-3 TaxID=3022697 RepID=UPI00234032CD|nr:bile acid:sodium symporter family protein [Aneurinibacillus sp. Ricciae_BoGa-3]WCK53244.1 bile acid:sodium symporter family protein [Aneurinibacillus sp. Ricciae_BoGa-3]
MINKLNGMLDRVIPLITPSSLVIGVVLGQRLTPYAFLVAWIFAFMTFSGSLNSSFKQIKSAIMRPLPLLMTLMVLHVIMPLVAWLTGHLLFSSDPYVITGLILGLVIPAGITSFIWVSIYQGNIGLTLSVILIDSLLSPFIVPVSMYFLVGAKVSMDVWAMVKGLLWMIVLPSVVGMALNHLTHGSIYSTLGKRLAPFSKLSIGLVVALNGAAVAPYLRHFNLHLAEITLVVLLLAVLGYPFGLLIGKVFKWDKETLISLTFNGGMRNISAGAVLAVTYFPSPVAIPVILGMLFQQLLASFYGSILKKLFVIGPNAKGSHLDHTA